MKVLLLSKYTRMGASSRLRTLQYLPYLQASGVEVTVSNLFDDDYLQGLYGQGGRSLWAVFRAYCRRALQLLSVARYDLIWIEYEIFPYLPAFSERMLRLLGRPYVVDYDDAVFHNYDLSPNPLLRWMLGRKIDVVMRDAACVVAGNAYLAERAMAAGARWVAPVPTVIDRDRYVSRLVRPGEKPVIGWIGSPTTQQYVVGIRDALHAACLAWGARLLLVGATPQVIKEFPCLEVEVVPWTEGSEAELIQRMDIGIMPLADGPWEKGKCGYKLIQYMACAVPVVASPVGVNVEIVAGSQCGLLAGTQAEWQSALLQLLQSPALRSAFGAAGRKAVEQTYSLQVQAPAISRVLNTVVQTTRA